MESALWAILAAVCYLASGYILVNAQSAVHEIEAGIGATVGTLFALGAQLTALAGKHRQANYERQHEASERLKRIGIDIAVLRELREEELKLRKAMAAKQRQP